MNYLTANEYFRARFGRKVYKLALSGGMTCPNRDGTKGDRGCIFCSASGSGDFAEPLCGDVFTQIERAKARVAAKLSYIAAGLSRALAGSAGGALPGFGKLMLTEQSKDK